MAESPGFSPRELKGLKKDELVRMVLKLQCSDQTGKRNEQPLTGSIIEDNSHLHKPLLGYPSDKNSIPHFASEIKSAMMEAVNEIKMELRSEYMGLLKDMRNEFTSELENVREEIRNQRKMFETSMRDMEAEFLNDLQESELRKNNVMIFGLKESQTESNTDRKEEDLKQIENLAKEIGVHFFAPPQNCIRLGKPGTKPRPIKLVGLPSQTRGDLLLSAPRINKINASFGFNRVFIKPDLTPKQQLNDRLLKNELKSRRNNGENVIFRNGKIVTSDERHVGDNRK